MFYSFTVYWKPTKTIQFSNEIFNATRLNVDGNESCYFIRPFMWPNNKKQ